MFKDQGLLQRSFVDLAKAIEQIKRSGGDLDAELQKAFEESERLMAEHELLEAQYVRTYVGRYIGT